MFTFLRPQLHKTLLIIIIEKGKKKDTHIIIINILKILFEYFQYL